MKIDPRLVGPRHQPLIEYTPKPSVLERLSCALLNIEEKLLFGYFVDLFGGAHTVLYLDNEKNECGVTRVGKSVSNIEDTVPWPMDESLGERIRILRWLCPRNAVRPGYYDHIPTREIFRMMYRYWNIKEEVMPEDLIRTMQRYLHLRVNNSGMEDQLAKRRRITVEFTRIPDLMQLTEKEKTLVSMVDSMVGVNELL